ncbi:MAG: DUF6786 family protein [Lentimonas sp.]
MTGCQTGNNSASTAQGAFAKDTAFMQAHTEIVLLKDGDAAVAVAPAYQGRVMTSTFDQQSGPSFGWINRPVIERGLMSEEEAKGKLEQHIYIFGGEERFWLGPEGGQFALYFKPGDKFEFSDWKTPAPIDTATFELVEKTDRSATFRHQCEIMNYSGTVFKMWISRKVSLLDDAAIKHTIKGELPEGIRMVGYQSANRLTNVGNKAWEAETGLPSIWILGMYQHSPNTNVVIPFKQGPEKKFGPKVKDDYFGKVPADYLSVKDDVLFFKGDGTRRGKIGISPQRTKGVAGSYDADAQVLTIVSYNRQEAPAGYVNSAWEIQKEPYVGDVINAYNDGSPEPGAAPLGPFYEIETSSPAAALKPRETMLHVSRTMHLHGTEAQLDPIAQRVFGVSLDEIKNSF